MADFDLGEGLRRGVFSRALGALATGVSWGQQSF